MQKKSKMMLNNKDIIIFSSIDWGTHKQLHHQLVESLINQNNNILYIENTGVRRLELNDFQRIIVKIKSWFRSSGGFKESKKFLTILVTMIFPFPYSRFFNFLNSKILISKINKWIKLSNASRPIIITFLPAPLIHNLIDKIDTSLTVYYCANHMSKGSKHSLPLKKWEELMFKRCDFIISISDDITNRAKYFNKNIYKVSPGVDEIFFKKNIYNIKTKIDYSAKPLVGYIGALGNAIDYNLLKFVIGNLQNFNFVFIGPVYDKKNFNIIKNFKNVLYVGEVKHSELPSYINKFDVAIVPYIVNEFTDSVYSCKLNEYLAIGKPVVSTSIKEHLIFSNENNNILYISNSHIEFKNLLLHSVKKNNQIKIEERIIIAKKNSWLERFKYLDLILNKELNKKIDNINIRKFSFLFLYKKSRIFFYKTISFSVLLYLLIFQSPFFWSIGNFLNDYDKIAKSDAIVVYSGNDSRFNEQSYLNRVLEAKEVYDKGFSDFILLISGKEQKIKEVHIMKSYLLNKGLKIENIFIFNEYPNSTYKGINKIAEYLENNNLKNVIYLTSKYHNKRSKLIWKKNYPKIKVITPKFEKNRKGLFLWSIDFTDLKLIIYEILAIIHNKFNKRL